VTDTITIGAHSAPALWSFIHNHLTRYRIVSLAPDMDGEGAMAEVEVERGEATGTFRISTVEVD